MRNTQLAMTDTQALEGFAARLNQLCDEKKIVKRGRPEVLRVTFKVSREAVRKWLSGMAYPTTAKRQEICQFFECTDSWLMTGKGDKQPVTSNLTAYQQSALRYMRMMTLDQQALSVRLLAQLLDSGSTTTSSALTTGTGAHPMALHEPSAH